MMALVFSIYKDRSGEWRWRLKAGNNRIIADSAEGYSTFSNAKRAAFSFNVQVRQQFFIEFEDEFLPKQRPVSRSVSVRAKSTSKGK